MDSSDPPPITPGRRTSGRGLTRRAVLLAGGAAALGVAGWWAREPLGGVAGDLTDDGPASSRRGSRERPTPVPADSLPVVDRLGGARLHYEITGAPTNLRIDPDFGARLDATLTSHADAAGWGAPAVLSTYGAWIAAEGEATSWHHAGRAFDVGRVLDAAGSELVSCRHDLWGGAPEPEAAAAAAAYWRLAASLHRDFAYVLTYLYDDAHANHIHVDDGLSGDGPSWFSPRSPVQVPDVQAMCRWVWGLDVEITREWDGATRAATEEVLDGLGIGGRLTGDGWAPFLEATARR